MYTRMKMMLLAGIVIGTLLVSAIAPAMASASTTTRVYDPYYRCYKANRTMSYLICNGRITPNRRETFSAPPKHYWTKDGENWKAVPDRGSFNLSNFMTFVWDGLRIIIQPVNTPLPV